MTAGGDHDELLAVGTQAIGHRQRLAAGRQAALPEYRAGVDVEGAQIIVHRRGDEDEISGGDDRPAQIWRAANGGARLGTRSAVVPSGTFQRTVPLDKSTATNAPQGGGLHGSPLGERSTCRLMP